MPTASALTLTVLAVVGSFNLLALTILAVLAVRRRDFFLRRRLARIEAAAHDRQGRRHPIGLPR